MNSVPIVVRMKHNVKIVLGQKAPAIRTDALVIRLDQIGAAFGIAAARQLHHLGPLVESSVTVAICGIVIIAESFNLRIIRLIIVIENHFTNIQIFRHYGHRSGLAFFVFPVYRNVVVATTIAFINKGLIIAAFDTNSITQISLMVIRDIAAATGNT